MGSSRLCSQFPDMLFLFCMTAAFYLWLITVILFMMDIVIPTGML